MTAKYVEPRASRVAAGGWLISKTCQSCGAPVSLYSDDEPDKWALKIAAAVACDKCARELEQEQAGQMIQRDFFERLRKSRVPARFKHLTWDDVDKSGDRGPVVEAVQDWRLIGQGLVLCGAVGTGKTYLAATAAVDILTAGSNIRWVSAPELLTMAGASYTSTERRVALSILLGHDPLVLDDLDRLQTVESSRAFLLAAIDGRINANAPLLITTNLRPSEIGERLGEAIMSRVAGSYFKVYELAGRDRRLDA